MEIGGATYERTRRIHRAVMKNKNGAKAKKGQTLKIKKKLILSCMDNLVPSTSSANNEATICPGCEQSYDEGYWIFI